ncbi:hypothetical protein BCAR13_250009 [Paraburkholderia caribensis]|nr:hypothetical protein BCAR13_250009 [Paraburkholderia caribensis]
MPRAKQACSAKAVAGKFLLPKALFLGHNIFNAALCPHHPSTSSP